MCTQGCGNDIVNEQEVLTAQPTSEFIKEEAIVAKKIIIDPEITYQTIDNFGASGCWSMDPIGEAFPEDKLEKIADMLFDKEKGIGLSAFRFNIGAGSVNTDMDIISHDMAWRMTECFKESEDSEYDWSKQMGQQWFLNAAKNRGVETLIAFVNSPPVWMTKNGHGQCDEEVGSTNLETGLESDFAIFICDVLSHFKEQDLSFNYISPVNEPEWDWNKSSQEGNRYNNEDIVRVASALLDELERRELDTQVLLSEAGEYQAMMENDYYKEFKGQSWAEHKPKTTKYGGDYNQRLSKVLLDDRIKDKIAPIAAVHSYWNDDITRLKSIRVPMAKNMKKYPNMRLWQTEFCVMGARGQGRDLGMDTALWVARTMHYDLTYANVSAWQWWLAISPYDFKDGLIFTDYNVNGGEMNVIPTKLLWAVGNFSRFIRPGSVRIQLEDCDNMSGLMGSAYKTPDGLAIVLINYSEDGVLVQVPEGYGQWTPYITSTNEGADLKILSNVDSGEQFLIPEKSVVTLICQYSW